ncbi:hypothetical protein [Methylocystis sp. S23]|jgi:hypothetical protein
MSIGSARRRFGATPCHGLWPAPRRIGIWRYFEATCILAGITFGNIAIVKIVDAFLDALHN